LVGQIGPVFADQVRTFRLAGLETPVRLNRFADFVGRVLASLPRHQKTAERDALHGESHVVMLTAPFLEGRAAVSDAVDHR
jgi:hypothetical protein